MEREIKILPVIAGGATHAVLGGVIGWYAVKAQNPWVVIGGGSALIAGEIALALWGRGVWDDLATGGLTAATCALLSGAMAGAFTPVGGPIVVKPNRRKGPELATKITLQLKEGTPQSALSAVRQPIVVEI